MEAREEHEHADDDVEREDAPTEEYVDDNEGRCSVRDAGGVARVAAFEPFDAPAGSVKGR
jgi:hypothetical protein